MWWGGYILILSCVELIGVNVTMDTYGIPYVCAGDPNCGSYTMVGGPIEYEPGHCYLPLPMNDPWWDFLWCQDVVIQNDNGPVAARTPCAGDPGITATTAAPYGVRVYWAGMACPEPWRSFGWCTVENVCTAADKLNGDCTCTAAEQANNECTP